MLIVRPKGQSLSLAAQIHGFRTFAENTLAGVILNGVSAGMYSFYKQIAEKSGLPVLGFLPPVPEAEIPDRHLGLVTADELSDLREKIDRLADAAEEGIDLHALCALAQTAKPLTDTYMPLARATDFPVRIAVAKDRAFCFYYEDNFDVLRELGAELRPFRRSQTSGCRRISTVCTLAADIRNCTKNSFQRMKLCEILSKQRF